MILTIDRKRCKTCENRSTCYTPGGWHVEPCENWTPKHGEWILTEFCRPNNLELVCVPDIGIVKYVSVLDFFGLYDASEVKYWMRLPEYPKEDHE